MRRQRPEARAPVRGRVLDQALQQLGPRARPGLEPRQAPGPEAAQRWPVPGPVQARQLAQASARVVALVKDLVLAVLVVVAIVAQAVATPVGAAPVGAAQVVARVSAVVQAAVAA